MIDLELRRYKAAIIELRAANLFTSMTNPDKPSFVDSILMDGRPPQYLPLSTLWWRYALFNICIYGAGMWFIVWRNEAPPITTRIILILLFSIPMGFIAAWSRSSEAKQHGLSRWEDLA